MIFKQFSYRFQRNDGNFSLHSRLQKCHECKEKKIILVTQKNSEIDDPKKTEVLSIGGEENFLRFLNYPMGTFKELVTGFKE